MQMEAKDPVAFDARAMACKDCEGTKRRFLK